MREINIQRREQDVNIDTATRTYHLPIASATQLGGIKVGDNLTIEEDGTLNANPAGYTLPTATASTLGGIKVGDKLSISDGTLSVTTDSSLSSSSTNPIQNNTVNSALTSLTSTVQNNTTSITNLNTALGNLTTIVNGYSTTIGNLSSSVTSQGEDITANTNAISDNSDAIASNGDAISDLQSRMTTAEDDIDNVELDISDLTTTVTDLNILTETEITYSYLLPVSTWTAGKLTYEKRGKTGVIYVDIQGILHLAGGGSTVLHTFNGLELYADASGVLLSDDGAVLVQLNATTGELTLSNITNNNQTITNLQGSIPLVF